MAGSGSGSPGRQGSSGQGGGGQGSSGQGSGGQGDGPARAERAGVPILAVVRGDASAEEIAALTAVLAAKSAAAAASATSAASAAGQGGRAFGWASRRAMLRKPLSHGPGAWRASARPGSGA